MDIKKYLTKKNVGRVLIAAAVVVLVLYVPWWYLLVFVLALAGVRKMKGE